MQRRIPLFALISALGLSAAEPVIFVGHKRADSVGVYDTASGKQLALIPVGKKPHEIALSADRKTAYVTNYGTDSWNNDERGDNTISILDVASRKETGRIDLGEFRRPHGISRGASGKLFVTTDMAPTLLVIDPAARKILAHYDVGQKRPHMVAISSDEKRAWVANSGSGTVTALELSGTGANKTQIQTGGVPMGIVLSKDGSTVYLATRSGNDVVVIDAKTNAVKHRIELKGEPGRVRLSPDGQHLFVTLMETGEVAVIEAATRKELRRLPAGHHPEGMHIDSERSRFYVSAQGDNKVQVWDLKTWQKVREIQTGERPDPIVMP